MSVPKLNKLQRIVVAIEDLSVLNKNDSVLKLSINNRDLEDITYEELIMGMQRLEDEQTAVEIIDSGDPQTGTVTFYLTNKHGIDNWAREIRYEKDKIPGYVKEWGDLRISMETGWLKYGGHKIYVGLEDKVIRLLLILIGHRGAIVRYSFLSVDLELASAVEIDSYVDGDKETAPDDLKELKQYIPQYLITRGMPNNEANKIKKMVVSVTNKGYRLALGY